MFYLKHESWCEQTKTLTVHFNDMLSNICNQSQPINFHFICVLIFYRVNTYEHRTYK